MNGSMIVTARRIAVTVGLVFCLASTAQAEHLVVCDTLEGLRDATGYLEYSNPDKDLEGLNAKLTEAGDKAAEGKYCDAAQKIEDYRLKLDRLVSAAKPKAREVHEGTLACIDLGSKALIDRWDDGSCEPTGPRGPKK